MEKNAVIAVNIGDRSISKRDFGIIQRSRVQEMAKWADKIKEEI